jgi:hypothetical protein
MVFPLNLEQRINRIKDILQITPVDPRAKACFDEFRVVMKGVQYVRNSVVHSIVIEDEAEGHVFHLRSKMRTLTKAEIFSAEELTNYAAHLAQAFRYGLGFKNSPEPVFYTLPDRPDIPLFLHSVVQFPTTKDKK